MCILFDVFYNMSGIKYLKRTTITNDSALSLGSGGGGDSSLDLLFSISNWPHMWATSVWRGRKEDSKIKNKKRLLSMRKLNSNEDEKIITGAHRRVSVSESTVCLRSNRRSPWRLEALPTGQQVQLLGLEKNKHLVCCQID